MILDSRPLSLTAEGAELYQNIAPILGNFESVLENFLEIKDQKKNQEINIAAHHVAISYIMPEIVNDFKKRDSESKLILRNIPPAEAIRRLKNREIDMALYPFYKFEKELEYIEVSQYKPMLIMNKSHPLANLKIESLSDLKKYDFIRIDKDLITLPLFEEAIKNYNINVSIEFENGHWEMLMGIIKNDRSDFVAVVSDLCVKENDPNLLTKDLSKFFPKITYYLAYNSFHAAKKNNKIFIDLVRDFNLINNN